MSLFVFAKLILPYRIMRPVQTFAFQSSKEIFHCSIIVGTTWTGHGRRKVIFLAQVKVCFGCVLRPLVTMEDESISGLFLYQRISDSIRYKGRGHIIPNTPCQYRTSAQIQYCTHVEHSARNGYIGNIGYPELVGLLLQKLSVQQIVVLECSLFVACIRCPAPDL